MAKQILSWGLLSTAKINRALIKPLRASMCNHLVAVASRTEEKAKNYAEKWGIQRAYGSYEALLADPDIDVIYNSLPNNLHADWTIKALKAGKHVLCEKPLGLTATNVDKMLATVKETGRVLTEAFMYRHHAQTLKVKEIVKSGILGKLQFLRGSFSFSLKDEENYRLKKEMGGGSIWDIGCYPISYIRMLVGTNPVEVFGRQVRGQGGSDLSFVGQMRFSDGVLAQFDSSFQSPFRTEIEVVGSTGKLFVPNPFKPSKREEIVLTLNDKVEKIKIHGQELYLGEVEDMADAVLLGKLPRISLEDSRENASTIRAFLESAESGKVVML